RIPEVRQKTRPRRRLLPPRRKHNRTRILTVTRQTKARRVLPLRKPQARPRKMLNLPRKKPRKPKYTPRRNRPIDRNLSLIQTASDESIESVGNDSERAQASPPDLLSASLPTTRPG